MREPILITGSHRSGTTWIGQTLSISPEVALINEPFSPLTYKLYRGRCTSKFKYWHTYITEKNEHLYYEGLRKTLKFNYAFWEQIFLEKSYKNIKFTFKEQLQFLYFKKKKLVPLLKDPLAILSADWVSRKFNARTVVLVRHPAAFCHSIKRLGWRYDFSELFNQTLLMQDFLSPFEKEILNHLQPDTDIIERASLIWKILYFVALSYKDKNPSWIYKRYEDIALNPVSDFRELFNQLNLCFSQPVENYIQDFTNTSNPTKASGSDWAFRKRNSRENIMRWKKELDIQEITKIRNSVEEISHYFYRNEDW
ncbi:MAG: sulfotransferase [Cyanobacteria bacterium P01_E01_bin.6]